MLGSIGGLLLLTGLAFAKLFEEFRPIVFLIFLFMVGIAPPLSASLIYLNECKKVISPATVTALFVAIKALLLCFIAALIALALIMTLDRPHTLPSATPILVFVASTVTIIVRLRRQSIPRSDFSDRLDAYLIVALATATFVFSPFNLDEPIPAGLAGYALDAPHFKIWALFGIAWTAAGIWLRRHEGWAFPRKKRLLESLAILAAGLIILGLYDDGHFVDMGHYMPLVGPALHALHGGIPMVDVYSVYGLLPWLVHRAAFTIFTPSFGTAAVVVRFINLAYFVVLLLIVFSVTRRRLSAIWFFVPALLVGITSHIPGPDGMWNINALPLTAGTRYLLPSSMTLLLTAAPMRDRVRWAALAIIMLASLSSIEILAFTLAPWGYCLLLDSVRARSVRAFLRGLAIGCAAIVAAQAAFAASIYLSTGAVVDYRPYFNLFLQFRPAEDSIWSVPFVPDYALWFPIGFAYFLILAAAFYRAVQGLAPDSMIERLLPVAALGLGPLAYFFGRPQEGTMNISCLPFAIVAIGVAETMFIKPRRFGAVGSALSAVMFFSFAFAIADGFEHFMRPLDPSRGNATILRRCFTDEGCRLGDVFGNIGLALRTLPLDPRTKVGYSVGDGGPSIEEATSMLRRLAPNAHYVGMLADLQITRYADSNPAIGTAAFMATGQWFAWSISSPIIDEASPVITNQILQHVAATPSGLLLIIANKRNVLLPIEKLILDGLTARCRLVPIETGKYNSAFITEDCKTAS